ncbi:MAG: ComEC/Rec2 family competence protein, partial [Promicromonosporaceae bacterium]|nr:ComEC/Rec2 family competence protein [Promicromonosporaceae bacterium]
MRAGARSLPAHLALSLCALAAVCLSVQLAADRRAELAELVEAGASATVFGTVASEPRLAPFGSGYLWTLSVQQAQARATTLRAAGGLEAHSVEAPAYGAVVRVEGALRPARQEADQHPGIVVQSLQEVRAPPAALRVVGRMRAALVGITEGMSEQARGLVPGMAIGDTSQMSADLAAALKTTSLTHLTAVSGGHFAIVIALLTAVAGTLRLPRALRALLIGLFATGFVLLVRPEPSVLRSAAMCAVMLCGLLLGRRSQAIAALSAAVMVLLLVDPWLARSFGFALSCAATLGLVLLTPPLTARLSPWLGRGLAFAVAVPLAAQLTCTPILLLFTPGLPTTGVIANLAVAPAMAPATLLGLAATVSAPWLPALARVLAGL